MNHEMPPSETLDCHPLVLAAVCTATATREQQWRDRNAAQGDKASWDRMHAQLGN